MGEFLFCIPLRIGVFAIVMLQLIYGSTRMYLICQTPEEQRGYNFYLDFSAHCFSLAAAGLLFIGVLYVFQVFIEVHFLCWLFYQFRKKELPVAMDRADHGGSVFVSGLLDPGHPVPELHRGLEAVADGGGGEHRDPVPGHHRLQPLPGDGRSACNHY